MRRLCLSAVLSILSLGWAAGLAGQTSVADREAMFQRYLGFASLVEGGVVTPHWLEDGDRFWFAENAPDSTTIILVDPARGDARPLFDTERTRQAVTTALGHGAPYDGLPFADLEFVDEPGPGGGAVVRFVVEDREFQLSLDDYSILPTGRSAAVRDRYEPEVVREAFPATNPDIVEVLSPDRRWFARDDERDLWVRSTADDRQERLTDDGEEWFRWSGSGVKWSPSSIRLAALKIDNRDVHRVPLIHWLKPHEEVVWWPFTKAGGPLPRPELHIVDVLSKRDVMVDVGEDPDIYLSILDWTPDGSELLFYRMNRTFDRLDLMAADPTSGASRIVLTETQPTFIKGINQTPGWTMLATPLSDGERVLWISERDGWDHLYLYGLDGRLIRRLTSGEWPVTGIEAVDEEEGWVYFTGHAETEIDPELGAPRRYDTHLYRVSIEGGPIERLSEATGQHAVTVSPSHTYFIDVHSTATRAPTSELRSVDGSLIQVLSKANTDRLEEIEWRPPEPFVVKAADGETDLYGVLFKPRDFDPTKRYPVLEYIYGGPQTVLHPRTFFEGVMPQAFAQLGYVTVVVDARGTPERGKAFQDVVHGNFGRNEIPDHAAALRNLAATRPYVDLDRVGLFGGSWGGYMTVRALVLEPELYDAGVATYPVVDLYDHMSQALEPYMGLPEQRPEAFEYGSSLDRVDQIEGKLLLIHGTQDVNATFSATMKMVDALQKAGKSYDLIVFPEVNHTLGAIRTYWFKALKDFFLENVPAGPIAGEAASTGS